MDEKFNIEQLSELTGLTRRTIRYCVQKGLIKPPAGRGQRGFYNASHLKMLERISRLRDKGLSFTEIRENLQSQTPEEWIRYRLKPGLEIHISRDREKKAEVNIQKLVEVISSFI